MFGPGEPTPLVWRHNEDVNLRRTIAVAALSLGAVACAGPARTPRAQSSTPPTTPPATIDPAGTATASPKTSTSSPDPTPSSKATVSGSTSLTEEDAGTTVTLKVGESVRVVLPAEYHQPEAQGSAVERTASSGGYPSASPATATFVATAAGTAQISSTTDYACLHATPSCSLPQRLWSVQIRVV